MVHQTPPYDVTKDFTPIINVAISPYALVVNPSVPAHSLKEFIAYAKANPGKLSYSSPGVGSASHLAGEMLKTMAGIDMVHVPNKGMSPAVLDLIGGQVQVMFASVPGIVKQKPDRLRPIAMAEMKRSALLPDLPTIERIRLAWICGGELGRSARPGRPRSEDREEIARRNHRHPRDAGDEGADQDARL